jgi:hypothetical protein
MTIDQRNAGASVTQTTANLYGVDRFQAVGSVTSKFTFQQSSVSPAGFVNSTLITSSAATSVGASEFYLYSQFIEGSNIADLAWGTANAATITLSFWVRSSLTGTFGGVIQNSDNSRNYPFSYTISTANTFEYKTITIAGDTSGTWLTTNGTGMKVRWSMGSGSTVSGTAGAWSGSVFYSATGATSVVGTSGATFYITGVQLEKGSTATPFEFRSIGTELGLCQRYFQLMQNAQGGRAETTIVLNLPFSLSTMRAAPSAATFGTIVFRDLTGTATRTANTPSAPSLSIANSTGGYLEISASSFSPANFTAGNLVALACSTGLNGIALSAEL